MRHGFFIGPDKSGSSWVHELLLDHPDVSTPRAKELFFFDRYFDRGTEWYESKFPPGGSIRVEVCHEYLFSDRAARRIAVLMPNARLLLGLRHPVDRAMSAYLYMVRQGRISTEFSTALREVDELVEHGRYGRWLSLYLDLFSSDQLLTFDFPDLSSRPHDVAQAIFSHLGVRAGEYGPSEQAVRPAAMARSQFIATWGKKAAVVLREAGLEGIVGTLKRSPFVDRALFRRLLPEEKPEVGPDDFEYVRSRLFEDSLMLDELLGADYRSKWWST